MKAFFIIFGSVFVFELLFWWWGDRRLRSLRRARLWRSLLGIFVVSQILGYILIFIQRAAGIPMPLPRWYLTTVYLWHVIILQATMVLLALGYAAHWVIGRFRQYTNAGIPEKAADENQPAQGLTRRDLLLAAAVAVPPLATGVTVMTALDQLGKFRVRKIDVAIPTLPADLEGLSIAQVSDFHIGRFTFGKMLGNVVEATNQLKAELVLLNGDLIDYSLSDLPLAIDIVKKMDPRHGLFLCQGNHDMFQSREEFDRQVLSAGLPLLINQSVTVNIRGNPVQILGLKWGEFKSEGNDAGVYTLTPRLLEQREPGAFHILMAHHPHAFDPAIEAGVPFMVGGHTHGGQLMLTKDIGPGPLFYRYWSGLYRRGNSSCVISNGVGNWFPLRINAPAEIVHVVLHRGQPV